MTDPPPLSQRASRLIQRLKTRKGRSRERLVLVEGIRAALTAIDGGAAVRFAVTSPRVTEGADGAELVRRLGALHVDVRQVTDEELERLSDTEHPQGALLVCEERTTAFDMLPVGRWLVLDAVQDPGNAGTLLRAAAAFGVDGVVALDGTVDLWSAKAVRASAGLVFRVPVARASADSLHTRCARAGIAILVADAAGEDIRVVDRPEAFALVMGNEGAGVRTVTTEAADQRVAVPMRGEVESLNVGIAGSILLYALLGERRLG